MSPHRQNANPLSIPQISFFSVFFSQAERRAALAQLAEFQTMLINLKAELARYSSSDPVQIEAKRKAVKLAKEAAFRYTDNVSILVSYVSNTFSMNSEDVRNTFGVPPEFDDLADS